MRYPLTIKRCLMILLGSIVLAFGLYHIHSLSGVTEGGQLGLTLLLQYWFHLSPAISGAAINVICYLIGWKTLGNFEGVIVQISQNRKIPGGRSL